MTKGLKIIEGTAEYVSATVTQLQAEGWKVKGELIYVKQWSRDMDGAPNPDSESIFAQAMILLPSKEDKEPFGKDQIDPKEG